MSNSTVSVRQETVSLPTYLPAPPDRNPMFLEKRVFQGSSGKVYPLPFTDRVATRPVDRQWKAIWIENEYLLAMVLPEIGGRIHVLQDKTNGYDLIYRQNVIKPALVGLAGPWVSGGIEFNWPQHHRPATFLPVQTHIEHGADGSITVWCSDHDPMTRMKGMHGVCLRPGRAALELRVRAYNRTAHVQTFLWWANVATRVHESYQSFFPPDVYYVADHARRSMSRYPLCDGSYYGVDYGSRASDGVPAKERPRQYVPPSSDGLAAVNYPANDLSFYANIPVPTSYMCMGSKEDFFGGYDHAARAGIVHIANHHISPGKKQWTWGNHEFGYAWDRLLTDAGAAAGSRPDEHAPYIEIMAGVYTDNQPDFSFLQPGETKTWTQYWYPIREIGPAQHANLDAAISVKLTRKHFRVGVSVTRPIPGATVTIETSKQSRIFHADLAPGHPLTVEESGFSGTVTSMSVVDADGHSVIEFHPRKPVPADVPPAATEPPAPSKIDSTDELFIIGMHLHQYRHATRSPTDYWLESIRRDSGDSRCNDAMGGWHLARGEWTLAERYFRTAIKRLTTRNGNPHDGESLYNLGLTIRYTLDESPSQTRFDEAYGFFYKSTWNGGWAAAAFYALAEMDCRRGDWNEALNHLDRSLRLDVDHLRARDLKASVLRKLHRVHDSDLLLTETIALDPLDEWAMSLRGQKSQCDLQSVLDLVHDRARAGLYADAISVLSARLQSTEASAFADDLPNQGWGAEPIAMYTLAWLHQLLADESSAGEWLKRATDASPDYCFPARLEEIAILRWAMRQNPADARAPYYLGNLFYDRKRYDDAIDLWQQSTRRDPAFAIPWRNLGIAYFNIRHKPAKARRAYDKAVAANPEDARLILERDQLCKRTGMSPESRLERLQQSELLVLQRDDLTIEFCALLNQTGASDRARQLLTDRQFQPWEGGEGQALTQWVRSHLAIGRQLLGEGDSAAAIDRFQAALTPPANLSESRHLLANHSDIHFWLGEAFRAAGDIDAAREHYQTAAEFKGDFQDMSVRPFSDMTHYTALAMQRLGRGGEARKLLKNLEQYAIDLYDRPATIDYFATSLPTMLLFDDDLKTRQQIASLIMQAQSKAALGRRKKATKLAEEVLRRDPNHPLAQELICTDRQKIGLFSLTKR